MWAGIECVQSSEPDGRDAHDGYLTQTLTHRHQREVLTVAEAHLFGAHLPMFN